MKAGIVQPSEVELAGETLSREFALRGIVGRSAAIRGQIAWVRRCARCDRAVLVVGESGTGKEVFARAIHYFGVRARRRFVPVNCGALPDELVENELFGHEPGAFTGALRRHAGLVEQAQGGTLFLDEIDSLSPKAQVTLLRFLQDRQYQPLGGNGTRTADVRIISASNADLASLLREGKFREDLYYRLAVLMLSLPPLRERRGDIPLLAMHLLERFHHEPRQTARGFSPAAMDQLMAQDWRGNVRELETVIARAIERSEGKTIQEGDLDLPVAPSLFSGRAFKALKARAVDDFERRYLEDLLAWRQGDMTQAAKVVGIKPRPFLQLLRKHNLLGPANPTGVQGKGHAPEPGINATKPAGGRPRKGTAEDVLAVLGGQKLGRQEWLERVRQAGMEISRRTFGRRKDELESGGRIVCDREGIYQGAGCQNQLRQSS